MKIKTFLFLKHIFVATKSSHIFSKYRADIRRVLKTLTGKKKAKYSVARMKKQNLGSACKNSFR